MCLKTYCGDCREIFGAGETNCEYCEKKVCEMYFCDTCGEEVDINIMIEYTIGIECFEACPRCYAK